MIPSISWSIKRLKVGELKEWNKNPRKLVETKLLQLKESIQKFGVAEPPVVNLDGTICGGHGRKKVLQMLNIKEVDCYVPNRMLTEKEFEELNIRLNKNIAGVFDYDLLANKFDVSELLDWGFTEAELDLSNPADDILLDDESEKVNEDECTRCPKCGYLIDAEVING